MKSKADTTLALSSQPLGQTTDKRSGDLFDFSNWPDGSDPFYDGLVFTERYSGGDTAPWQDVPIKGLFVTGTARDDMLFGSELSDEIHGLDGDDRIEGGGGNDHFVGGAGADKFLGGAGFDTVSYADLSHGVELNLRDNTAYFGDANGDTFYSIERVVGTNFDDLISGDDNGNVLDGGGGSDILLGGISESTGTDVLLGGAGDDRLASMGSQIWMTGGEGADEFCFTTIGPSVVTDFTPGIDKIWDLAEAYPNLRPFGQDGVLACGTEMPTVSNADGDCLFYDTDDYSLYRMWSNVDGTVTVDLMATFTNGIQLQASDFVMYFD